jgi:hypothetical protein
MTKITKVTIGDQRITGTRTGYKLDDFNSLRAFYAHSAEDVIIFSIDGAEFDTDCKPTDKAKLANKRFLSHFLNSHGTDQIALLEGHYDGVQEYSYAVKHKVFHDFVVGMGYVLEQFSILELSAPITLESVFNKCSTYADVIEMDTGDALQSYTTLSEISFAETKHSDVIGWTYCNKSEEYYKLV